MAMLSKHILSQVQLRRLLTEGDSYFKSEGYIHDIVKPSDKLTSCFTKESYPSFGIADSVQNFTTNFKGSGSLLSMVTQYLKKLKSLGGTTTSVFHTQYVVQRNPITCTEEIC